MTQAVKAKKMIKENLTPNSINNNTVKSVGKVNLFEYIRKLILGLLLIIIFYPPYLRGLYFEREQLPTEIAIFCIFCLYWVYKYLTKDKRFLQTPIEYASFCLTLTYAISIVVAAGLRLAILEWLKYCMYFSVFFMLSDIITTYRTKIVVLWTMMASALGVSIMGIDSAAGGTFVKAVNLFFRKFLSIDHDLFFALFNDNRIYSTIQYPNALASYLMAAFFITLGLTAVSSNLLSKAAAGGINAIFLITFVLTQSRGAFIMLPAVILIYLLVHPTGKRIQSMAYLISTMPAIAIALVVSENVTNPASDKSEIWHWVLIGVLVSGLLTALSAYLVKLLEKINWKVYAAVTAVCIVLSAVGVVYIINASVPLIINVPAGQVSKEVKVKKSLILKPDMEYKLIVDVNASTETSSTAAYYIDIVSKNESDILFYTDTVLTEYPGGRTIGTEKKEISFKVPADSKIINIAFRSSFPGTKAEFNNGAIIKSDTGEVVNKLIMSYKYLPDSVASRMEDIMATRSGIERGIFYRDGLKIVKDRWLLGAGGGAWSLLYFQHQSYAYPTTQAHNYFLQLAVECGILGIITLLFLLAAILAMYLLEYRYKKDADDKDGIIQAVIFTSIAAMFMHSAIDFDLSLSAIFLLIWQLIGVFNARYRNNADNLKVVVEYRKPILNDWLEKLERLAPKSRLTLNPLFGLIITAVIVILPLSMVSAKGYTKKAMEAVKNNNIPDAIRYTRNAVNADPFNPLYMVDFANLVVSNKNVSQQSLQEANQIAERADKLSKFNYFDDSISKMEVLPLLAQYYFSTAETEKGLSIIRRNFALRPLWPEKWQERVNGFLAVALYHFKQNNIESAINYIDQSLNLLGEAETVNKKNMKPFIFNAATQEMLEKMKYVKENITRQQVINIDKVIYYNMPEMDVNTDGIPDQWTPIGLSKITYSNETNSMVIEDSLGQTGMIQSRYLTFLPGNKYAIEVEVRNPQGLNSIPFTVTGISLPNEGLKPIGNIFAAEVTIPSDFKRGNNTLQLFIPGKIEINDIKIIEK